MGISFTPAASAATGAVRIVEPCDAPAWNEYVEAHANGTIFHTAEMIAVYEAAAQHEPFAAAAVNKTGDIVAMLAAVRVETVAGMAGGMAARSVLYAEPLCNDDAQGIDGLVQLIRLHDQRMRTTTLFSEVRCVGPPGAERVALQRCGYEYNDYLNYVVDLQQDEETLWKGLSRSCRKDIGRSRRKDVVVQDATSVAGVEEMYELVQCSYNRSKIPLANISLFHAALEHLPEGVVQIRIARHDDAAVAAGIVLVFKGVVYAWYGGTNRVPGISPFDCLTWDEIRWGQEQGERLYDFGGAGWPDEEYGPREFKAKFGGELVSYGRYRKVYSSWKLTLAKTSYWLLRKIAFAHSSK